MGAQTNLELLKGRPKDRDSSCCRWVVLGRQVTITLGGRGRRIRCGKSSVIDGRVAMDLISFRFYQVCVTRRRWRPPSSLDGWATHNSAGCRYFGASATRAPLSTCTSSRPVTDNTAGLEDRGDGGSEVIGEAARGEDDIGREVVLRAEKGS